MKRRDPERRAGGELRAEGRRLSGIVIRYGDVSPTHRERFEAGSLRLAAAIALNLFHDGERAAAWHPGGGLELRQDADALRMVATLPPIPAADRALALVRAGEATGLSVEFHADAERRDGAIRVIEAARLTGIGIVKAPSYAGSRVEARARRKREWIRGGVTYGVESYCECLTGECNRVVFRPVALSGFADDDVLAIVGRNSEAVGSTKGGTLRLRDTDEALKYELDTAGRDTAAGRQLTDLARSRVSIYGRPLLDDAESEFTEADGVRTYTKARMRSLLLKPISGGPERTQGWQALDVPVDGDPPRRRERRRTWL